jgi:hypothetical protein
LSEMGQPLCDTFNIEEYPTLFYFREGEYFRYPAIHEYEMMVLFIEGGYMFANEDHEFENTEELDKYTQMSLDFVEGAMNEVNQVFAHYELDWVSIEHQVVITVVVIFLPIVVLYGLLLFCCSG